MRSTRAFSLLEVLLAMVFLSASLVLLSQSWTAAFGRVKKTQISFELASLLDRKMDDYIRKYENKSISEIPEEETDDFGDDYPQYSWKMQAKDFEFPDLSATLTAQSGGVDTMTLSIIKSMTTQISKAIKEVTVTVIYKGYKKNIEVNATTYFVDFDKPISLTGGG